VSIELVAGRANLLESGMLQCQQTAVKFSYIP